MNKDIKIGVDGWMVQCIDKRTDLKSVPFGNYGISKHLIDTVELHHEKLLVEHLKKTLRRSAAILT